jgi:hypothetical protein
VTQTTETKAALESRNETAFGTPACFAASDSCSSDLTTSRRYFPTHHRRSITHATPTSLPFLPSLPPHPPRRAPNIDPPVQHTPQTTTSPSQVYLITPCLPRCTLPPSRSSSFSPSPFPPRSRTPLPSLQRTTTPLASNNLACVSSVAETPNTPLLHQLPLPPPFLPLRRRWWIRSRLRWPVRWPRSRSNSHLPSPALAATTTPVEVKVEEKTDWVLAPTAEAVKVASTTVEGDDDKEETTSAKAATTTSKRYRANPKSTLPFPRLLPTRDPNSFSPLSSLRTSHSFPPTPPSPLRHFIRHRFPRSLSSFHPRLPQQPQAHSLFLPRRPYLPRQGPPLLLSLCRRRG